VNKCTEEENVILSKNWWTKYYFMGPSFLNLDKHNSPIWPVHMVSVHTATHGPRSTTATLPKTSIVLFYNLDTLVFKQTVTVSHREQQATERESRLSN
jgi:hypothetical protein